MELLDNLAADIDSRLVHLECIQGNSRLGAEKDLDRAMMKLQGMKARLTATHADFEGRVYHTKTAPKRFMDLPEYIRPESMRKPKRLSRGDTQTASSSQLNLNIEELMRSLLKVPNLKVISQFFHVTTSILHGCSLEV